jgi:hypothetical protein
MWLIATRFSYHLCCHADVDVGGWKPRAVAQDAAAKNDKQAATQTPSLRLQVLDQGGLSQQMRGSCSPLKRSMIRVPPIGPRHDTRTGRAAVTIPITAEPAETS